MVTGAGLGRLSVIGQFIPLTHYPPLYSIIVGGFSILTRGDALFSARILACLLFGANSLVFGYVIKRYTGSSWAGIAGTGLFLVSLVSESVIIAGLSEGLFLLFFMLAIFFATEYHPGGSRTWFIFTCLFAALACLTRYVGLTIIMSGLVGLVLFNHSPWKSRIKTGVIFCAASLFPTGLWYLRDWLLTGSTSNRVLLYHWPGKPALGEAIVTVSGWFLRGTHSIEQGELFLLLVGLIAGAAVCAWWLKARSHQLAPREMTAIKLMWGLLTFILVYCLSLLVSRSLFDASTHWDTRILSPLYYSGLLFFIIAIWYGTRAPHQLWGKLLVGGLGLYLAWLNIPQSATFLKAYALTGYGYTNKVMQTSLAIANIKSLTGNPIIYSNNAAAIYFNAGKLAEWIPEKYDSVKEETRTDYTQNLQDMRKNLGTQGSLLVIFKPYQDYNDFPSLSELTQGLRIVKDYVDATLYAEPPN
jgi:hypothetical protein